LGYLPKITSTEERTLMVSIHGATTAFLGGVSPVVWGLFLKRGDTIAIDPLAFQLFFVTVFIGAVFLVWRVARLNETSERVTEPLLIGGGILRSLRAVTFLINLIDLPPPPGQVDHAKSSRPEK
jgi:hypothetical protein